MSLKLITPPEGEIVTLEEAKVYMRVDHSDDDALINELIEAARIRIEGPEGKLNAIFLTQTWDLILDRFPAAEIMLPLSPVQEVTSVSYFDEDGFSQTVPVEDYYLDSATKPPYVLLADDASWPDVLTSANVVTVRFVAGYPVGSGDDIADNVPAVVKLAVKQLVLHWYEHRDAQVPGQVSDVPEFLWGLLQPYKVFL